MTLKKKNRDSKKKKKTLCSCLSSFIFYTN